MKKISAHICFVIGGITLACKVGHILYLDPCVQTDFSIVLNERQLHDVDMLLIGGFAPLFGFMNEKEYNSVIHTMRLPSGIPFPIPITLDVSDDLLLVVGTCMSLLDVYSNPVAKLLVDDLYRPNRSEEALQCYGNATDVAHPAIRYLLEDSGSVYVGGKVMMDRGIFNVDYAHLRLSPVQVKHELTWAKTVIAFQTRNPLHVGHVSLILQALNETKLPQPVVVLLHPVVGPTKIDDVPYSTRVQTYQALLSRGSLAPYADRILLALLPLAMRFGGPREAVLHMLIRKNFGATHFIVGRDHAGCKRTDGTAAELADSFASELQIAVLKFTSPVPVSGSAIRDSLSAGLPSPMVEPVVAEILAKIYLPIAQRGLVVMLVGLSGSGKTTLALAVKHAIESGPFERPTVTLLDGDAMRQKISRNLGFSQSDRIEHLNRILFIASEIAIQKGLVIVSTIAPYRAVRQRFKDTVTFYSRANFVLIHVNTTLAQCASRDTKGLYLKASQGTLPTLSGVHAVYEPPTLQEASLTLDGSGGDVSESAEKIIQFLVQNEFLPNNLAKNILLDDIPHICGESMYSMVVEIPRHTRAKLEYRDGAIRDDGRRFKHPIPVNYGFIPRTLAGDGDPLDIIEMGEQSLAVGQVVCVRVVGILWFTDQGKLDHKVIASRSDEYDLETVRDWFLTYKQFEGKPNLQQLMNGPNAEEYIAEVHAEWTASKNSHSPDEL